LDGGGKAELFADYSQWQTWVDKKLKGKVVAVAGSGPAAAQKTAGGAVKKKLSYLENREWASLEARIAEAEQAQGEWKAMLEEQDVLRDATRLAECYRKIEMAQHDLDQLYGRWVELEEKIG
jgi:ATP-binding cassette subfamily F protein uup